MYCAGTWNWQKPPQYNLLRDNQAVPSVGQNSEIAVDNNLRKSKVGTDLMGIAPGGIEPPTSGLGNRCSILLSYGAIFYFQQLSRFVSVRRAQNRLHSA